MNPWVMAGVLVGLVGLFVWSARRRWALLRLGAPTWESRVDRIPERLATLWTFGLYQKKMRYYFWAGIGHQLIFLGFVVLLLRTLVLWGRGFDPSFNLWILAPDGGLGGFYAFLKDVFATLVLIGTSIFVYYRVIRPQRRMALGLEGLLILGIIATMMIADLIYDGAITVLNHRYAELCAAGAASSSCDTAAAMIAPLGAAEGPLTWHLYPEPASGVFASLLAGARLDTLIGLGQLGFWTHAILVLVFLNILPYSKHFHIITALPNIFLSDLQRPGRLRPLAKDTEELMGLVEKASESEDMGAARIGYARIGHFTWKDMLDFYTCTECGRCSDNCPATLTGKKLSPKHYTLDLRDHLYSLQEKVAKATDVGAPGESAEAQAAELTAAAADGSQQPDEVKPGGGGVAAQRDLVPDIIDPDVLWACTTCRACEEQCPVNITYVDKIVQMRRNLVVIRGEFPAELNKPFEGMEVNGNPWNLSRMDRANWAEGLGVRMAAEHPTAEVLFWVGCAASYDDRAKKIARATAQLLTAAGVDYAILGEEETCTGDPARRAGNEYLFSMLAETNVATLSGYREQGGVKRIVTTCPHCFNTLKNEYTDFGIELEVINHTDFLLGLVAEKKLEPTRPVKARVAYHDSCYLGRYNGIYDSPREILRQIQGVELVEVDGWNRSKGLCCGAGGAQMFMEEQNNDRVNVKRTKQLLETGAETIASACPFCMTMLTDGLKAESKEDVVKNLDVVELLAQACELTVPSQSAAE
ncbi:MAG: (Fe-S)-binding protein [Myxococcales bacterium]|jgi:Fe-S oxidoreductase|nr:(Fe-S)-binding protein [Myxococcales bacterium]